MEMNALKGDTQFGRLAIIAAVTLIHVGVGALFLMIPLPTLKTTDVPAIDVQFADPAREPVDLPEPVSPLDATPRAPPSPRSDSAIPSSNPSPQTTVTAPEILTQLDASSQPAQDLETAADGVSPLDQEQVAAVLNQMTCAKLARRRDDACPKTNPFDVAEAAAARASREHKGILMLPDLPMSAMEQFLAKQNGPGHMFPGMDADLFADPMAPGAYDAARIRNGDAPLWSEEMKRGFTKKD